MPEKGTKSKWKITEILLATAVIVAAVSFFGFMFCNLEPTSEVEGTELLDEEWTDEYGDKWGPAFVTVQEGKGYDIVYLEKTKVMFVVRQDRRSPFTVLVDENGKPLLYREEEW